MGPKAPRLGRGLRLACVQQGCACIDLPYRYFVRLCDVWQYQSHRNLCLQINYYAMQNVAANFEDPLRFWPERWLRAASSDAKPQQDSDNLDNLADERGPLARAFLPYSAGPRSCIGQSLAMMEVCGCRPPPCSLSRQSSELHWSCCVGSTWTFCMLSMCRST